MKKLKRILIVFFLISVSLTAKSGQQFAALGNLKLDSGKMLLNCNIGYRTFGTLNKDSSNVIIYPTWFGGTSAQLTPLIAPGKLVDSTKYFVIAIDALSNGVSTSPSNSKLQSGKNFPQITINDMVKAEYRLLTEHFGLHHIFAVIGGSMGSMQALEWVVSYPDFIDKAVPYAATPRQSSYDLLELNFRLNIIESERELGADDKTIQIKLNYITQLFVRTPEYIVNNVPVNNFEEFLNKKVVRKKPSFTFTIDNYRTQLKAMLAHNIYRNYNNSVDETVEHIKTKIFFIVNKTDHLLNPAPAIELAKKLNSKLLILENDCGHIGIGCEMKRCSDAIQKFLDTKK